MGKVTGLAHIGVRALDMDAAKKFYIELLGFKLDAEVDMGGVKLAFLSNGNCLIELIWSENATEARGSGDIDHICVEVEGIDELADDIKAKGVSFDADVAYNEKLLCGVKNCFFRGPSNERIEMFDYMGKRPW